MFFFFLYLSTKNFDIKDILENRKRLLVISLTIIKTKEIIINQNTDFILKSKFLMNSN